MATRLRGTQYACWRGLAGTQPERGKLGGASSTTAVPPDQLAKIRLYPQQQRALGRDAFKAMVAAKPRRFAPARPTTPAPKAGKAE